MRDLPLVLKCPGQGEEWPITSYNATVDALVEKVYPRHIHFWCPAGHTFTLSTAKREHIFSKKQVADLLAGAQIIVDQNRGSTKNWYFPKFPTQEG